MKKQDFEFLINLLRQNAGWEFDEEQYFVIDKKISNFIREKSYPSVEDLVAELKVGSRALIAQVVESMAFSDTSFCRDYDVYEQFQEVLLPRIIDNNRSGKKLRFWSLGCSTGQEAYSVAFALKNKILGIDNWDIHILGTDISSLAVAKAQKGIYNNFEVQMGLNARDILEYFTPEGEQWRINPDMSKLVEFRRYNMLDRLTTNSLYDIIFCRNVLRYFAPEYQEQILARISQVQTPHGILYLGKNEHVPAVEKFYERINGFGCAYICRNAGAKQADLQNITETSSESLAMPSFKRPNFLSEKRPFAAEAFKKNVFNK